MKNLGARARALLGLDHGPDNHTTPRAVLLVSASEIDRSALECVLANTRWRILSAANCAEALEILQAVRVPVVLSDRDLPGRDWRESVGAVLATPHPVCVVLASRVADSYLWEEVIQRGGFDLVTKPFQREQVMQTPGVRLQPLEGGLGPVETEVRCQHLSALPPNLYETTLWQG